MKIVILPNSKSGLSVFLLLILFSSLTNAQVSGISASKLNTINALPVANSNIEFEPSFQFIYSSSKYNSQYEMEHIYANNDSLQMNSCMNFRFTYGISSNWEVGFSVPSDVLGFSLGSKYLFVNKENFLMAVLTGINTGSKAVVCKQAPIYEGAMKLAGGLALSWQISEKLSIDIDNHYQKALSQTSDNHLFDYFINLDAGYYINKNIQPVIGLNYYQLNFQDNNFDAQLFAVNLGITIETAEQFIMVINVPNSILGKNRNVINGFGFALTVLLD